MHTIAFDAHTGDVLTWQSDLISGPGRGTGQEPLVYTEDGPVNLTSVTWAATGRVDSTTGRP